MPKVPTVGLNASPLPGLQAPGVTPYRSAVPRMIQEGGKAMEGLGKVATEVAFKVENDINDAVTLKSNNRLENFANRSWQDIQQLTGQEAMDAKDPTLNGYAEERKAILEGLENDVQRRQFAKFANRLQDKFGLKVEGHYIGAVAENKQQQLLSTLLTVEDSIKSQPLGPEAVSGFLRWQQTTQQIIAGQGIQGELAETTLLKKSSEFIKSIFNNYVDAGRSEDALKFAELVEVLEQAPLESVQGPQSLRGKTYEEAKQASAAGKEPIGAILDEETRMLLRQKAEKVSMDTWAITTADQQSSLLGALEHSEEMFTNKDSSKKWTASQREAFESAAYNKFRLQSQAATQSRVDAISSAQSEFETTGKITLKTEDNLRKSGKWFDYLRWQQSILSGQSRSGSRSGGSLSTDEGLEWLAMYGDNPENDRRVAETIDGPEDLRNLYNKVVEEGVSRASASKYVQTISKIAFPGKKGGDELLEQLGIKDKEGLGSRIEAFWGEQFVSLKEEANFGSIASEQTDSQKKQTATIKLLLGREESFTQDVQDNIRAISREYPDKTRDEIVDIALKNTWSQNNVTYTEDGNLKHGNFLLMSHARQRAVMLLKNPAAATRSLEQMANTNRMPADPDSPFRNQTILDAAYGEWEKLESQKKIAAQNFDRRKTLRALEIVNLVPSSRRSSGSIGVDVPLPSSLAPNANPSDLELLELGFQIQEEDLFASYARQEDISASLSASIYKDAISDDWVSDMHKKWQSSGEIFKRMRSAPLGLLKNRYLSEEMKNYWITTKGLTEESYMKAVNDNRIIGRSLESGNANRAWYGPWSSQIERAKKELEKLSKNAANASGSGSEGV